MKRLLVVPVAALALAATACGGGDKEKAIAEYEITSETTAECEVTYEVPSYDPDQLPSYEEDPAPSSETPETSWDDLDCSTYYKRNDDPDCQ